MRTLLLSLLLISAPLVHATDSSSDQRGAVQANFDDFQANYNSLVFSLSGYITSLEDDEADVYAGHQLCSDGQQMVNLFQNNARFAKAFDKTYAPDLTYADSLKMWQDTAQESQEGCAKLKKEYDKLDLSL